MCLAFYKIFMLLWPLELFSKFNEVKRPSLNMTESRSRNNEDHKYYFIDISEELGDFITVYKRRGIVDQNQSVLMLNVSSLLSTLLDLDYFLCVWLISVISPKPLSGQTPANADQNNLFSSVSIFHPPLSPQWSVVTSAAGRPDTEATFTFILYLTRPKCH